MFRILRQTGNHQRRADKKILLCLSTEPINKYVAFLNRRVFLTIGFVFFFSEMNFACSFYINKSTRAFQMSSFKFNAHTNEWENENEWSQFQTQTTGMHKEYNTSFGTITLVSLIYPFLTSFRNTKTFF